MALSLVFMGCKREHKGWDIDALVPLVDSKLDLQNLFEDSLIKPDQNNLLRIVYRDNFLDFKLDEDFVIPDTAIFTGNRGSFPINWDKRFPLISDTNTNVLNISQINLKYLRVKSGSIKFKIYSSITEPVVAKYVMPIATDKDGKQLSVSENIPAAINSTTPTIVEKEVDLSGYLLDLRGTKKNKYNTIQFYFQVTFLNTFQPDTFYNYSSKDYVDIESTFSEVVPEYGKGVFLTQTFKNSQPEDDAFDVFKNFISGSLLLDQAKFNFVFNNYVGADLTARVNQLVSLNEKTGKSVPLSGEVIGQSINVARAKEDYDQPYPHIIPEENPFSLNDQNSNIVELIENLPTGLDYEVEFTINPLGNVSGGNDFIYNGYGVKAALDVEIPLCIRAENLLLVDTTDFAPGSKEDDLNQIKGGFLNIYCDNLYPLSAKLRIDLIDENGSFLMTLLEPNSEIKSGIPESDGVVKKEVRTVLKAPISPSIIDQFYLAKRAIVYLTFNSPGTAPVKLYSFYNTKVKVVGDVQYNVIVK
ncbi:MAG: hypothetical protein KDC83_12215 [Flavobacteriales bacterium]|nr:hypothetical protein [Flavobacteriales bacterium]